MTVEMFDNISTDSNDNASNNSSNDANNIFSDPNNFFNFTGSPVDSNSVYKHFSNDEDYFDFVCEYRRTAFSLTYKIVTGIIGLFLAYRTCGRLNGITLGIFLFFYLIIVALALFEIIIHIVVEREKSKKICKKYYSWLFEHRIVKIILSIVRWILFILIIILGIGSFFQNTSGKNHNNGFFNNIKNNRNNNNGRNINNRNNNNNRNINNNNNRNINNNNGRNINNRNNNNGRNINNRNNNNGRNINNRNNNNNRGLVPSKFNRN